MQQVKTILISRTDAIGDVLLTLPLCGYLKEKIPGCKIIFLCKSYTMPIVHCCAHIDEVMDSAQLLSFSLTEQIAILKSKKIDAVVHTLPNRSIAKLCKEAGIAKRIGTRNRWFHWLYCNTLVKLSRKNSDLHEAQLNIALAKQLVGAAIVPLAKLSQYYGFKSVTTLSPAHTALFNPAKKYVIIHPKSSGSAREWPLDKYQQLIDALLVKKYEVIITGTQADERTMHRWLLALPPQVHNLCGKLSLSELIALIAKADTLIACSTGPLHIAATLGIQAIGLYPAIRPMHIGRWGPIGKHAVALSSQSDCFRCTASQCSCIQFITVAMVLEKVVHSNYTAVK